MKKTPAIILLSLVVCLCAFAPAIDPLTSSICDQPAGTKIIGSSNTGGSLQTLTAGDMRIYLAAADYSCSVDELRARITASFTAGEYVTLCMYTAAGNKLQDGAGIEGDGTYGYKADQLDAAVQAAQGTDYILAIHTSADIQISYEVPGDSNQQYKTVTGHSYTHGSCPATIDVTGMTSDRQQHIYGVNP